MLPKIKDIFRSKNLTDKECLKTGEQCNLIIRFLTNKKINQQLIKTNKRHIIWFLKDITNYLTLNKVN